MAGGGGGATVTIVVTPNTAGLKTSVATAHCAGRDPVDGNSTASEDTTVRDPSIGDLVWDDQDGDGIRGAGEPGIVNVVVTLYDGTGTPLATDFTEPSGLYLFDGLTYGADYQIRFTPPDGYVLTLQDQGSDDLADSDADPVTWRTPLVTLVDGNDPVRWDAGMIPDCVAPDEPVYIYKMTLTDDGNAYPVLHFQDPNPPLHVTGYHVYRSSEAALPPGEWPRIASDVEDMDEAEPDTQWVDASGDESPTGTWFYQVTAYNHHCPAEGPR
jgi:hypothetical protein